MIVGLEHIEFVVRDIDEAASFFKLLGFKELRRGTHHGKSVQMQLPGDHSSPIIFEFHLGEPGERPGMDHIAFKVDSTEKTVKDFESKGIKFPRPAHQAGNTKRVLASFRDPMYMKWQLSEGTPNT